MKTLLLLLRAMIACISFVNIARGQSSPCTTPLTDIYYTKYTVAEGVVYTETNYAPPVLETSNAYLFEAVVDLKTNYSASSAQLILPDNSLIPMRAEGTRNFGYEEAFTNSADLLAAYPGGAYQFVVSNEITTVSVPSGATLPNAPTLSDYAANQSINPSNDFTLRWNAFSGGKAKDVINVVIDGQEGEAFVSPDFRCPDALNGLATSILIPANTLTTNEIYSVRITFVNVLVLDTNSTPFVALLAGTEAETLAQIATVGANIGLPAPTVSNAAVLPDGSIRFDVSTTGGTTNVVQSTGSLSSPITWTPLLTTNPPSGVFSFTNKPTGSAGFYRVVVQ